MGLGKTVQTLSFLATLKEHNLGGPHLVVTPLAVLQNWQNEVKKFCPGLSSIKLHGTQVERDRIFTMPEVLRGDYDIYLTTYEMLMTEESFFTENLMFHTIIIDEGHRIKSDQSKLTASLARISAPFRLLLTGTPLQNSMNELWSLLHYILPAALKDCREQFEQACSVIEGQLNKKAVSQARALLETLMLRRIKSEVEKSLKPKIQYVLKVPLSELQRKWYRRFMDHSRDLEGIATKDQIISVMSQLQKTINHPKVVWYGLERERKAARSLQKRAEGSEFFVMPDCLKEQSSTSKLLEQELQNLQGRALVSASGKLQLLDRLLTRLLGEGSRVLVFSQFTMTMDVLCEYFSARFGPEGQGYLRLDGATNRIKREMDVRSFNQPNSTIPVYCISTRAGGQGINLATADVVCLYDTCWNPQVDLQAQDRSHRIGQKKQVRVFRLIAEHTMEERILTRARQKLVLDAMVIKKKGESSAITAEVSANDETSDEAAMAKLSIDQLWKFLKSGFDYMRNPTIAERPPLTDADCDTIIEDGRIVTDEHEEGEIDMDLIGEEASPSKDGIGGTSLWHEDEAAAKQLIEEEDEMAAKGFKGVGKETCALLQKASGSELRGYLEEINEDLPPSKTKRDMIARIALHVRSRDIKIDGHDIFDLQSPVLYKMCNKRGLKLECGVEFSAWHGRGEMLEALLEHAAAAGTNFESADKDDCASQEAASDGKGEAESYEEAKVVKKGRGRPKKQRPAAEAEEATTRQKADADSFYGKLLHAMAEDKAKLLLNPKTSKGAPAAIKGDSEISTRHDMKQAEQIGEGTAGTGSDSKSQANDARLAAAMQGTREGRRTCAAPKRFCPPSWQSSSERETRKLYHEEECFNCNDGGELIECTVCPKVYHPDEECSGLPNGKIPKGAWYCPWHACFTCGRKSSQSGGMLFHCQACPTSYCFDCCPEEYKDQRSLEKCKFTGKFEVVKDLERKGLTNLSSWLFFTCVDCVPQMEQRRKEREELERQQAERVRLDLERRRREREEQERRQEEQRRLQREMYERNERLRQEQQQQQAYNQYAFQRIQQQPMSVQGTGSGRDLDMINRDQSLNLALAYPLSSAINWNGQVTSVSAGAAGGSASLAVPHTAEGFGWRSYVDNRRGKPTYGLTYWHNSATGATQWEAPAVLQRQHQQAVSLGAAAPAMGMWSSHAAVSAANGMNSGIFQSAAAAATAPMYTVATNSGAAAAPAAAPSALGVKVLMSAPASRSNPAQDAKTPPATSVSVHGTAESSAAKTFVESNSAEKVGSLAAVAKSPSDHQVEIKTAGDGTRFEERASMRAESPKQTAENESQHKNVEQTLPPSKVEEQSENEADLASPVGGDTRAGCVRNGWYTVHGNDTPHRIASKLKRFDPNAPSSQEIVELNKKKFPVKFAKLHKLSYFIENTRIFLGTAYDPDRRIEQAMTKAAEEEEAKQKEEETPVDSSNDYCEVCGGTRGELVCCDFCECAYHGPKCLGAKAQDLPDPYKCPKCDGTLTAVKAAYEQKKQQKMETKKAQKEAKEVLSATSPSKRQRDLLLQASPNPKQQQASTSEELEKDEACGNGCDGDDATPTHWCRDCSM